MASAVYSEPTASRLSISLEGEASASPFPSPSSSFLPPPTPSAHEFAVKPAPPARNGRKSSTTAHISNPPMATTLREGESGANGDALGAGSHTETKSARSSINGNSQTLHSLPNGSAQQPSAIAHSKDNLLKEMLSPAPPSPMFSSPTTPTPYHFQHHPPPPQTQAQGHLTPMESYYLEPPRSPVVDQSTSSSTTPTILTSALPPENGLSVPSTPDAKKSASTKESPPPPSKIVIPENLLDVTVSASSGATPGSVPTSPAFSTFSNRSNRSGRSRPISTSIYSDPSLFSSRAAPPSPAMSRRVSGAPSIAASTRSRSSRPPSAVVSRTNSLRKSTASVRSVKGSPVLNPHRQSVGSQLGQSYFAPLPSPRELTFSGSLGVPSSSGASSSSGPPVIPSTTPVPGTQKRASAALSTSSQALASPLPRIYIKVRDFGFPASDPRHSGQGPDVPKPNRVARMNRRLGGRTLSMGSVESSDGDGGEFEEEDEDEDANGWSIGGGVGGGGGWDGFRMGLGRFSWTGAGADQAASNGDGIAADSTTQGDFPSRMDLDRNFLEGASDEAEDGPQEYLDAPEEDEDYDDEDSLYPGLYRALYAFEPEGTAEMRLEEDQLVRVVGRGGGVGWAVVIDEKATAAAAEEAANEHGNEGSPPVPKHALVPESYLEPVRLDDWEDEEGAVAAATIGEVVAA